MSNRSRVAEAGVRAPQSPEILKRHPHLADLPPTPSDPVSGTPARRAGSVRRTSTIDMTWPGGFGTPLHLDGRSRDLLTPLCDEPRILGEARMLVTMAEHRKIHTIEVTPHRERIGELVGAVGGSELRHAIDRALPGEREEATPLHLLLDDVAGSSLIAPSALTRWPEYREQIAARVRDMSSAGGERFGVRKGRVICSGLRPKGWFDLHRDHGLPPTPAAVKAGVLHDDDDALAWHAFPTDPEIGTRRHRRIDLWREKDMLVVDSYFRDSCWEPDGNQMAIHEYSLRARVDASAFTLEALSVTPHVLPFPECRWATPHADDVVGMTVTEFRSSVQETLTDLRACTHLNDMLRSLAEVPALAAHV